MFNFKSKNNGKELTEAQKGLKKAYKACLNKKEITLLVDEDEKEIYGYVVGNMVFIGILTKVVEGVNAVLTLANGKTGEFDVPIGETTGEDWEVARGFIKMYIKSLIKEQ